MDDDIQSVQFKYPVHRVELLDELCGYFGISRPAAIREGVDLMIARLGDKLEANEAVLDRLRARTNPSSGEADEEEESEPSHEDDESDTEEEG